jgi:hypothetical protein
MSVASPDDVPLSVEPVVGWRVWVLRRSAEGLRLGSIVHDGSWTPQQVVAARCTQMRIVRSPHRAPLQTCTCGYYATTSWGSLCGAGVFSAGVGVVGAIGMWGTVIEHRRGVRSEFAYPARLRLVCGPCLSRKVVRDPIVVLENPDGRLSPRCSAHADGREGTPAREIQAELLGTYAVDLLPKPSIPLARRLNLPVGGATPGRPRDLPVIVGGVLMMLRVIITTVMALWLLGVVLGFSSSLIGGVWGLFSGGSSEAPVAVPAAVSPSPAPGWTQPDVGTSIQPMIGIEPHRGPPPARPIPEIAFVCGIGMGKRVEIVSCGRPVADVFGFAEGSAPRGERADCVLGADAYSRGPRWHVCWTTFEGAHLRPWPASTNPFAPTRPGGA